jgi:prevent-host-death family protein
MARTVAATEARVHFGEVARGVVEEETPAVVEQSARPRVAILSMEDYQQLRAGQPGTDDWWEMARRSRERIDQERGGRPLPSIEGIVRASREERDAQILANLC